MTVHLVWLHQDLHQHDNLAPAATCRNPSVRVLALYVTVSRQWTARNVSPCQAELINMQPNVLQIALAEKDIPLLFHGVDDFTANVEIAKQVCARYRATRPSCSYQYEVNKQARDVQAEKTLRDVVRKGFDDGVILPPGAVMIGNRKAYKVSTLFKSIWSRQL